MIAQTCSIRSVRATATPARAVAPRAHNRFSWWQNRNFVLTPSTPAGKAALIASLVLGASVATAPAMAASLFGPEAEGRKFEDAQQNLVEGVKDNLSQASKLGDRGLESATPDVEGAGKKALGAADNAASKVESKLN